MTVTLRVVSLFAILALGAGCGSREKEHAPPQAVASLTRPATNATPSAGCAARLVTGDGVGPIRIDLSLDSVRRTCPVVRDTTVRPNIKDPPERLVSVLLGADTAVVSVQGGRVTGVLLAGRGFATADSLGIGTPLRRLLGVPRVKVYGVAGRLIVMTPAKCGLRFDITGPFNDLPEGVLGSAVLDRLPLAAMVDRIHIDGCDRGVDEGLAAADDSTFDVQTDTVQLARDLDGNGVADFVVRESRPFRRSRYMHAHRLAVYFDSIPASRRPSWASPWDLEGADEDVGEVAALSHGSLLVVNGNNADYTSETLLVIRDGTIAEEMTHGEDYGAGFLEVLKEGGKVVVDASLWHVMLRGKPVGLELECKAGDWPAVRMPWDESARRFVPERPRCVKARWPGDEANH
jgi:hypothetical protein